MDVINYIVDMLVYMIPFVLRYVAPLAMLGFIIFSIYLIKYLVLGVRDV